MMDYVLKNDTLMHCYCHVIMEGRDEMLETESSRVACIKFLKLMTLVVLTIYIARVT